VIAELDCLLATRRGMRKQLAAVREPWGGVWELAACAPLEVREVIERFKGHDVGGAGVEAAAWR
jgi:hypothetical protein